MLVLLLKSVVVSLSLLGTALLPRFAGAAERACPMSGHEAEVSIAIDPSNPDRLVVAGHEPRPFRALATCYTTDGGKTWAAPVAPDDGFADTRVPHRFDPTVVIDSRGRVYVGYGVSRVVRVGAVLVNMTTLVVCHADLPDRTRERGYQYNCTEVHTAQDPQAGRPGNDRWQLATGLVGGNDVVLVAWTRGVCEPGPLPCGNAQLDLQIVMSRSDSRGATWTAPQIVSDDSLGGIGRGSNAEPVIGPDGTVFVSWHTDRAGGVRSLLVDRAAPGGAFGVDQPVTNLTRRLDVSSAFIPPQPTRGIGNNPTIEADTSNGPHRGRLYIAYTDEDGPDLPNGQPNTGIFLVFSDDRGAKWSAPRPVNSVTERSQFHPWVAVDRRSGLVALAWYDARRNVDGRPVDLILGSSRDGGQNFTEIRVTPKPSNCGTLCGPDDFLEYVGLAVHNCVAFPVWSDNSLRPTDLDFLVDKVALPCPDTIDLVGGVQTGSVHGVGAEGRGGISMLGRFVTNKSLNLGAAAVTFLKLFTESEELIAGLPIALAPELGSRTGSAIYRTAPGANPTAKLTIKARGRSTFDFRLDVSGATIRVPSRCPSTQLTAVFTVNDPFDTSAVEVTAQPTWRCFARRGKFEYLRTP